jgi:hypothetical protein
VKMAEINPVRITASLSVPPCGKLCTHEAV